MQESREEGDLNRASETASNMLRNGDSIEEYGADEEGVSSRKLKKRQGKQKEDLMVKAPWLGGAF